MGALDIANGSANILLIQAIRITYRVVWTHLHDDAADHVRFFRRAWLDGDRESIFMGLGTVKFCLSSVDGAHDAWLELRHAIDRAQDEQYPTVAKAA
jgi:hypothetical protein